MDDALQKRGRALEEIFFQEQNRLLLERMKKELEGQSIRESLAKITGITNQEALKAMTDVGINPESLVAMSMIPLVTIAWSDGVIQASEKEAILKAAQANNLTVGSAGYALFDAWLKDRPGANLLEAWKLYIKALRSAIDTVAFRQIELAILERAENIAKAAGGFLGMAAISESESKILDELRETFA